MMVRKLFFLVMVLSYGSVVNGHEVCGMPVDRVSKVGNVSYDTPFGAVEIDDPLIAALIESPAMQRLKDVDQSGIVHYCGGVPAFKRFDHCLGVYLLLKRFGVPYVEQVAGLLHDASHTIFSHVGDYLFKNGDETSGAYQDDIHEWYLEQQKVANILSKHGFQIADVLPKREEFKGLEQELPDMCADRIEYNLHTAYLYGILDREGIEQILSDLFFQQGIWYFNDPAIAKKFASLSLYFTEYLFESPWNKIAYHWCAKALRRALDLDLISLDDVHFSTDTTVLKTLLASRDPAIAELMRLCWRCHDAYLASEDDDDAIFFKGKFRGIDPQVMLDGKLYRLTDLDDGFAASYHTLKAKIARGIRVVQETSATKATKGT